MAETVVVDTNQITNVDWRLEKQLWRRLFHLVRRGELRVIVPEIVVAEAVGKFRRESASAARTLRTLHIEPPDTGKETDQYEEALRHALSTAGVHVPAPSIDVLGLVDRATSRRPPFDDQGRNFRDSAIWMHVLDEAERGSVALISNDGDFYINKTDRLLEPLTAEAAPAEVTGFKSIAAFLAHIGREPIEKALEATIRLALADAERHLDLTDEVTHLALREPVPVNEDGWRVTVSRIQSIDSIEPVGVRASNDSSEDVIIELLAMADAAVMVEYLDGEVTVRNTSGTVSDLTLAIDAKFVEPDLTIESVAALPVDSAGLRFLVPPHVGDSTASTGLDEQSLQAITHLLREANASSSDWSSLSKNIADQMHPTTEAMRIVADGLTDQMKPMNENLQRTMEQWASVIDEQLKPMRDTMQQASLAALEQIAAALGRTTNTDDLLDSSPCDEETE